MKKIKLKNVVSYSKLRSNHKDLSLETYITTDNLLQNKLGIKIANSLPPNGDSFPKYINGNILVSNIRPYLKKIWFANRSGICSADVLTFETQTEFSSKFIYYNLFQDAFFEHMMKGAKGTKMPRGEKNQILEFEIPDFPFSVQEKIAEFLSAIDNKIQLNNKINDNLEQMAKTLYDYWFVQFDFPDANGNPYKTSGGKMVWNEELKREIPEGSEVKPLHKVIETILDHRGKTPKKLGSDWTDDENGIIALSAKIVKGGKLNNLRQANKVSKELYNKWMPTKLINGDILMTSEAPAGEFYFIQGKTDYCMSQRLFGIRANQLKIISTYLYYELSKGNGYSQIMGSLSGSTVFGIRQDVLRKILVVIPNLEIQKKFNKIVLPQLKQIKQLDEQNQELASLRDWLLPMLMNGQITVKG
ncbi:restriction endonuclease subunit S [Flavobacterium sp. IMCC34518]|uniref:restriction endonuclease subunit S n=1 Tax=Flavobacterium sp. IMCC34518 TaxID=3003623 RepID=UPI0022AC0363|nr:restriction endonuclease subunit S [Flavobacterium sp. IMCC34518]